MRILIDADGCPVREETYRVAERYGIEVIVVSNSWMRVPDRDRISLEVVGDGFDEADDRIVDRAGPGDIVIAADIPLAARCLEKGARVVGTRGREFTEETIGDALGSRELLAHLRECGTMTPGPAPFGKRDRSRFLQTLDAVVNAVRREHRRGG
jgi:uncharacterized protein YaiI (UPF0178 family)